MLGVVTLDFIGQLRPYLPGYTLQPLAIHPKAPLHHGTELLVLPVGHNESPVEQFLKNPPVNFGCVWVKRPGHYPRIISLLISKVRADACRVGYFRANGMTIVDGCVRPARRYGKRWIESVDNHHDYHKFKVYEIRRGRKIRTKRHRRFETEKDYFDYGHDKAEAIPLVAATIVKSYDFSKTGFKESYERGQLPLLVNLDGPNHVLRY